MASKTYINSAYRPDIQGLRAVSVLLVILFHAGITGFDAGYLGVDIFFVISGYWMTMIITQELNQGTFRFRDFYARRIRRILPALYFSLLLTLIVAWFVLWPQDFRDFMKVLGSTVLLFSNNTLMILGDGYFAAEMEYQPLLHMWSLSVEEQFYLIFPLFLFITGFLWKNLRIVLFVTLSAASLMWTTWSAELYSTSTSFIFYQLPGRVWEFAAGGLAAWWVLYNKPAPSWLGYFGLLLILIALSTVNPTNQGSASNMILAVIGATFLLIPADRPSQSTHLIQVLSYPALVWIGGISFSLYLVHQPILAFSRHFGETTPYTLLLLSLAIGVPLAGMMKTWIEDPFRNKSIIDRKKLITIISAFTLSLISIAIYAIQNKGLPDRFDALTTSITSTAWGSPLRKECHDVSPEQACIHFGETKPSWVILGDSHTPALAYALGEFLQKKNQSILHLSVSGCGLANERPHCQAWYTNAIERILKDDSLQHVVLSNRFASQMYGKHKDIWPDIPRVHSDKTREKIRKGYREAIKAFHEKGKQVIWVQQAPEVGPNLSTVMRDATSNNGNAISVTRNWWNRRTEGFNEYYRTLEKEAIFIDPAELFCDTDNCYAVADGITRYRDRDHMSLSGAREIVTEMNRRGLLP